MQEEKSPLLNNSRLAEGVLYQSTLSSKRSANVAALTESMLKSNQPSLNSEENSLNEHHDGDRQLDDNASMGTLTIGAAAKPEAMESNQSSMQRGDRSQPSEHGDQQLEDVAAATEHVSSKSQPRICRRSCK